MWSRVDLSGSVGSVGCGGWGGTGCLSSYHVPSCLCTDLVASGGQFSDWLAQPISGAGLSTLPQFSMCMGFCFTWFGIVDYCLLACFLESQCNSFSLRAGQLGNVGRKSLRRNLQRVGNKLVANWYGPHSPQRQFWDASAQSLQGLQHHRLRMWNLNSTQIICSFFSMAPSHPRSPGLSGIPSQINHMRSSPDLSLCVWMNPRGEYSQNPDPFMWVGKNWQSILYIKGKTASMWFQLIDLLTLQNLELLIFALEVCHYTGEIMLFLTEAGRRGNRKIRQKYAKKSHKWKMFIWTYFQPNTGR